MKKIVILLILCVFLVGCNNKEKIEPVETHIITGVIEERSHMYYTTHLLIKTDDGIKYPVFESHSDFSSGLNEGDRVCFEIEKINGSGYKIIGFGW